MQLLFKQRFFSWLCSYDIFDEDGNTVYVVKGQLSWGHLLKIFDKDGNEVGTVKQRIFTFLPQFEMYKGNEYLGCIRREFTFFRPKYVIEYNGWQVEGDWFEWDYSIVDRRGEPIADISKQIWNFTDTYKINVIKPENALYALMLVLAIDAEKCSRDNH